MNLLPSSSSLPNAELSFAKIMPLFGYFYARSDFNESELCVRKWAGELEQCHIAYYPELVKLKIYTHAEANIEK